jgi:RimK-like ATP-grasp domain
MPRARQLDEKIASVARARRRSFLRRQRRDEILGGGRFQDDDHAAALEILATFDESDDLWIMTTRLFCAQELGRRHEAEAETKRIVRSVPVYIGQRFRSDLKTILVINSTERIRSTNSDFELHFNANFPTQLTESLAGNFNFISVLPGGDFRRLGEIKPDLVLNNMVNAELLSRDGKQKVELSSLAESFGVPVINHPLRAALTTRQRNAFSLSDLNNVRTPKTIRFKARADDIDNLLRLVETKMGYPLIIRPVFTHFGVGMARIENGDELGREIRDRTDQRAYVHEFIENRTTDRLFRKIRVAVVGDEIMPILVEFDEDWNVHGRTTPERKLFYRQRRHLLDFETGIFRQPNQILSTKVMQTLQEIRRKIPLDIFGIDFDVMPDGTVLFLRPTPPWFFMGATGKKTRMSSAPKWRSLARRRP